jgi:uncharacterized protein (TIGR03083 family)
VSERGIEALKAERAEVLGVAESLSPEEWAQPSDCAGWRVQDVVIHMACVYRQFVDPTSLAPGVPGDTEASQDARVGARKGETAQESLADYISLGDQALIVMQQMQDPAMGQTILPLEDLGSHPMHLLANAVAFDHFCHLRNDVLRPNGPIDRQVSAPDELRLGAAMEWLLSGLPQMSPPGLGKTVVSPVVFQFDGPGGGTWTLHPAAGDGSLTTLTEGADPAATAAIATTPAELIIWGTHRRPWRERDVRLSGDEAYGAAVADQIHVF